MQRARAAMVYESNQFQYTVAGIIIFAFVIDLVQAQIFPQEGTFE
jgi:hypothetical protein